MTGEPEAILDIETEEATESAHSDGEAKRIIASETESLDSTATDSPASSTVPDAKADSDVAIVPPSTPGTTPDDEDASAEQPARKLFGTHIFGTLLIAAGLLTIVLTVGITAWNRHRQDAENQAFLRRVATPAVIPATPVTLYPATTPFPSTVSGALVPDTARTPTANAPTRSAQPVATTTDGKDRRIIAAAPAPTATPVAAAPAAGASSTAPAPTPKPRKPQPTHLTIPAIRVNSDVTEVGVSPIEVDGQQAYIWDVAPYAVGHHFSSANPGEGENVVLSGHDDWQGEVFKNLYKLKKGDEINLHAGDRDVTYHVDAILLLPEVGESLEKRLQNATFIGTTGDERLTLVTCWPYGVDDHRLIVIARPGK